jgi:hypothetical protein
MSSKAQKNIESKVVAAAEFALTKKGYVTAIDVFVGTRALSEAQVKLWRNGSVPYLERVINSGLGSISRSMKVFRNWAKAKGLSPSETVYYSHGKKAKALLRFSKSGDSNIEKAYRTHFVSQELKQKAHIKKQSDGILPSK